MSLDRINVRMLAALSGVAIAFQNMEDEMQREKEREFQKRMVTLSEGMNLQFKRMSAILKSEAERKQPSFSFKERRSKGDKHRNRKHRWAHG